MPDTDDLSLFGRWLVRCDALERGGSLPAACRHLLSCPASCLRTRPCALRAGRLLARLAREDGSRAALLRDQGALAAFALRRFEDLSFLDAGQLVLLSRLEPLWLACLAASPFAGTGLRRSFLQGLAGALAGLPPDAAAGPVPGPAEDGPRSSDMTDDHDGDPAAGTVSLPGSDAAPAPCGDDWLALAGGLARTGSLDDACRHLLACPPALAQGRGHDLFAGLVVGRLALADRACACEALAPDLASRLLGALEDLAGVPAAVLLVHAYTDPGALAAIAGLVPGGERSEAFLLGMAFAALEADEGLAACLRRLSPKALAALVRPDGEARRFAPFLEEGPGAQDAAAGATSPGAGCAGETSATD